MKLDECFQLGVCSLACPKGLDPRTAIEETKALYNEMRDKKMSKHFNIHSQSSLDSE